SMNSNGLPGSLLYKMPGEKVQIHEGIYKFVTYTIKPEGILTNDRNGIFIQNGYFIGWKQPYDVLLNVGLDLTSNLKNKIYYNVGFEWVSSTQNGALLMRPIFGDLLPSQPITVINDTNECTIFPTCTRDIITLQTTSTIQNISMYNLYGQLVLRKNGNFSTLSLKSLQAGMYICEVTLENGNRHWQKIILQK
ncbi:MAG TPA: T9SS type A sorting domain-containing protein, partial [Bacteroidales bacterium]|nr:T9SS type A sorting domain-containing protein [Bacteroidales bacterium]